MKRLRRYVPFCIVGIVILAFFSCKTYAAGEKKTDSGFIYKTGSYVTITGYTGKKTAITVPATINGKRVKKIDNSAFWFQKNLKKVVLPNGLKVIGISAFFGCDSLTAVSIPNTVHTIGMSAFAHCPSLVSVTLPASLKELSWSLFEGCSSLKKVKITAKVTSVGCYAFSDCVSLESVSIPGKVVMVGDRAFRNCAKLSVVKLPAGLEEIAEEAFLHCKSLKSITLPHKLEEIGDYALGYYVSSGAYKKLPKFSISCHKGTTAYDYAKENGLTKYLKLEAHTLKTNLEKANLYGNGSLEQICTKCGVLAKKQTIYYPKTFSVVNNRIPYTAKVILPGISVKDIKGNLISSDNYSVSKVTNCKLVGRQTVKVTFKKNYTGSTNLNFTISPVGSSLEKLEPKPEGFTVYWIAQKEQTTGYQIQYADDKSFSEPFSYERIIEDNPKCSANITKLQSAQTYYVRIRTFKTISGIRYYSNWSKSKSVTTE